jgi:predicted transposase YbfD/YdcC
MGQSKRVPAAIREIIEHFETVPDPRVERTRYHPLVNIIVMALCGAVCGADGWDALETYVNARIDWFSSFLDMPRGAPSADTFRRVFSALDPKAFEAAFRAWVRSLTGDLAGKTVAIDGKTLRGAVGRSSSLGPFHLVHVWLVDDQLLLAQQAVTGAPEEVAAVNEMIPLLDLAGATVTADANSCTAKTTATIRDANADYVLAVKGNRRALHTHVKGIFADAEAHQYRGIRTFLTVEKAHGRTESRTVRTRRLGPLPPHIKAPWTDLHTAVQVERTREVNGKVSHGTFYHITSLKPNPELIAQSIRGHWSIENQLHYCLDVTFREDARAMRDQNGVQNFALLTRAAMAMLRRESSTKKSLAMKRRVAAWDPEYLLKVLTAGTIEF